MMPPIDLTALQTESQNTRSALIDQVPTIELCKIINDEDATVADAVKKCLPTIAEAVDGLAERARRNGRVIYVGAGTSGRLGVLDASEIPPTYSAPLDQFVALVAGGDAAIRTAQEGAEDDVDAAIRDLQALKLDPDFDSLIGIAASGRTPFVLSSLRYAKNLGCLTIGVACSSPSAMGNSGHVDFMIAPVTGAEVVTGSTRMKAGTATKLVLNMLSTGSMIRTGKTFGNMMVDLKATNLKLRQRSRNILRAICGPVCPASDAELNNLLLQCNGSVKLALCTLSLGTTAEIAQQHLDANRGMLTGILKRKDEKEEAGETNESLRDKTNTSKFVLCVDAGGSKCAATIMGSSGESGSGLGGPCNVTDVSLEAAMGSVELAIQYAKEDLLTSTALIRSDTMHFSTVWVALAGYDRPGVANVVNARLARLFSLPIGEKLRVTNDIELHAAPAGFKSQSNSLAVLIAGTGSVAMSFHREGSKYVRTGRSGGWGHLLGDDGGGYDLGRGGIRTALEAIDERNGSGDSESHSDTLLQKIIRHFGPGESRKTDFDLLSAILTLPGQSMAGTDQKAKIAEVAKIVLDSSETDIAARDIMLSGAKCLAQTLRRLFGSRRPSPSESVLVLAGSLMVHSYLYREALCAELATLDLRFKRVEVVPNPAYAGAQYLSGLESEVRRT